MPISARTLALLCLAAAVLITPGMSQEPPGEVRPTAVVGVVVDEHTGRPLTAVRVDLEEEGARARSTLSDNRGRFRFSVARPGPYRLVLSILGYSVKRTPYFRLGTESDHDAGRLGLSIKPLELAPIEVNVSAGRIRYGPDRVSYWVRGMSGSEAMTAVDFLTTIHGFEVDFEGRVTLSGGRVAISVDGREIDLRGASVAEFLARVPLEFLERLEVLDDSSLAGREGRVVNLVLADGVELRSSGSVFIDGSSQGRSRLGLRGSVRSGRWAIGGGLVGRISNVLRASSDLRTNLVGQPSRDFTKRSIPLDLFGSRKGSGSSGKECSSGRRRRNRVLCRGPLSIRCA